MNELLNLQPVFEQEYKRVKAEAIEFIHENLKIDTGETMDERLNVIKKLIEAQKKSIMYGVKADGSEDVDNFTHSIIHRYYEYIPKYRDKNISYYIKNYLHVYREEQKDTKHVYPHHYKLSSEGIVKLIAKDNALMLVFANLYALKNFKIETIEDCMERLNNNFGYEEIQHDYERFKTTKTNPNSEIIEEKTEVVQPVVMSKQQGVEGLKPKQLNSNQRIFVNNECYMFFKSLQKSVRERYKLADYSFIFRRMQKDSYIYKYVTEGEFREFLSELSIDIEKTKILEYCTTEFKEHNYHLQKAQFKLV